MPKPGQSAFVIPVPALDGILAEVAARWPARVRAGVPAHLTLLYPFAPAGELTAETIDPAERLFSSSSGPLTASFNRVEIRPGIVLLPPEPAEPLLQLSRRFYQTWPQYPPYGGSYGEAPAPHVTVALGASSGEATAIEEITAQRLPLSVDLDSAALVVLSDSGWSVRRQFVL